MSEHRETEMGKVETANGGSKKSSPLPSPFAKQESVYEKLDKTKFLKHYRPDDSFFQRKDREFNFKSWIQSKFTVSFEENLPLGAIGDLPESLKYALGTFGYLLLLTLFLIFLINGYLTAQNVKFISLDPDSGTCDEVPVTTTESAIFGDYDGLWNGANDFQAQHAMYQLEVTNFQRSTDGYRAFMSEIAEELAVRSSIATVSGPAENLVVWMSWHRREIDYVFSMTGSPRVIFNRQHQSAGLSSRAGLCPVEGVHGFDTGAGTVFLQYVHQSYERSDLCVQAWTTVNMGYLSAIDGPIIRNAFDVTSVVTAIAVNTHVLEVSDLLPVNTSSFRRSTAVVGFEFFDEYAPFMYPITCVRDGTCFLIYNDVYMYPIFFHYGETSYDGINETRIPRRPCSCPLDDATTSSCNDLDLVVGFIFYNTKEFAPMEELLREFDGNYRVITDAAYNATVATVNPFMNFQESNYDFCTLSHGSCSIVAFNVFDEERAVSPYYYVVEELACSDSLTTPNWERLVEEPPFTLIEPYYECKATKRDAFQDALGIAVGNATFWVPLLLCGLLPLVYIFLNYYKDAPSSKREYGDDEMMEAAKHIGLILLRVRDGKYQSYDGKLVEHYLGLMDALQAPPTLATEGQMRQAQQQVKRRSSVHDSDDSDAEIDPLDDIANAGNHPTGNKAYYTNIRRVTGGSTAQNKSLQQRAEQSNREAHV